MSMHTFTVTSTHTGTAPEHAEYVFPVADESAADNVSECAGCEDSENAPHAYDCTTLDNVADSPGDSAEWDEWFTWKER